MLALLASVNTTMAQDDDADPDRTGRLLKVELPLTGPAANRIVQQIREVASKMPVAVRAEDRSVLVLEFDTQDMNSRTGSDLGGCISLSEFLSARLFRPALQAQHPVNHVHPVKIPSATVASCSRGSGSRIAAPTQSFAPASANRHRQRSWSPMKSRSGKRPTNRIKVTAPPNPIRRA